MKKWSLLLLLPMLGVVILYLMCPKPELISFTSYSKAYLDNSGKLLRLTLSEDDRYRLFTPIEAISSDLIEATLLYEDQNYYQHRGVDSGALLRAFWATYIVKQRRIGASTIPMQVARLRWQINSTSLAGKIQQILRALQITRHYSKQEILQVYLNLAPYGRNIEGIGAASRIYFNKPASQLSLPEAITLAVIPQNPNARNPTQDRGYQRLLVAREHLLQRWLKKYPTANLKPSHFAMPLAVRSPGDLPFIAPHFIQYLNTQLSRWQHGEIRTSLDSDKQKKIERIVEAYLQHQRDKGIRNAAALLLNYKTMEIESMLGSADFYSKEIHGQVNGTLAKRSPGSSLKPFVYALAMDQGLIHPMSLLKDSPTRFGGFTPENYDKKFAGPILASNALIESRNVPAVELQASLSKPSFYDFLQQAGIAELKAKEHYGLALALGGVELTMLELVSLYAMLANGGVLQSLHYLQGDRPVDEAIPTRMLSREASFLVLDMLAKNPQPKQLKANFIYSQKNQVAWKTGTSWAFRDAWAIGVSGPYVLAVWIGNFDGSGNDAFIGRSAAGPLMFSIFSAIFPAQTWTLEEMQQALNIKKIPLCQTTGDLPGKYCPSTKESWFIPGVSPIKTSNIYRNIPIDKHTGLRACWHQPGQTEPTLFEFWPSDFLSIFKQAGIALNTPPPYISDCNLNQTSSAGLAPKIRSPQSTLSYVLHSDGVNTIPFTATADSDVDTLFWFVNNSFVGTSSAGKPYVWKARNGEFDVRVVDDSGRFDSVRLRVLREG